MKQHVSPSESLITIVEGESGEPKIYYEFPEPTSYSSTTSTMIDSGTSVSGKLLSSVIREAVSQISVSWNYLSAEDWAELNQVFEKSYINKVRFFDQTKGDWSEREMYVSDRGAGMWRRDDEGNVLGWTGCSLQLTEV